MKQISDYTLILQILWGCVAIYKHEPWTMIIFGIIVAAQWIIRAIEKNARPKTD